MNFSFKHSKINDPKIIAGFSIISFLVAGIIIFQLLDYAAFKDALQQAGEKPAEVVIAICAFLIAFILRAIAWKKVLPSMTLGQSLAGIHLSLGANHVLPLRLGEPLRVLSITKRSDISLDAATASTLTLRSADILSLIVIGVIIAPSAFSDILGWFGWLVIGLVLTIAIASWKWLKGIVKRNDAVTLPGPTAIGLTAIAWILESVLVWQSAHWAGLDVSWPDALLVTTVAVAAQIAAIAPGGFGTYEAAAVAAYVTLGYDAEIALVASLTAHALKTSYSLIAGAVAMISPQPSFIGRFRLQKAEELLPESHYPDNPVLLFLPAFNEEDAVGDCIDRIPDTVCGLPVECLVIDDGSTDKTAEVAKKAGAEVISLESNQGLGAAVRVGLSEGVKRQSSAIVFADADGEYPPEELENLVAPILKEKADYVVGSRFLGDIEFMRPHRRFGNLVLTKILSIIARRKITDGQSGYRAFSPAAASSAEVIHDFNYAQIITLDLLAKGYVYLEVPISYHFRTTGESFIKLFPYLRKVVPAVYKELNSV